VLGGQHDLDRFQPHELGGHLGRRPHRVAEQHVEVALGQRGEPTRDAELPLPHLDLGVLVAQPAQHQRAGLQVARGDVHPQHRPPRRPGPHRGHRLLGQPEQPAGPREKRLAGRRQGDPAGVAHEQRFTELPLELSDRRRQRLLGQVEPARGAGEVQLLGHRDEVPEVPQFGRHPVILAHPGGRPVRARTLAGWPRLAAPRPHRRSPC
jgi:hypothetical protein